MSVVLRWYKDGKPDGTVPYPFLTADDGAPLEFPDEAAAVDWIGADLVYNEALGCGWRVVPLGSE